MERILLNERMIPERIQALLAAEPRFAALVQALIAQGAILLLVGGAVRDILLGLTTKDLDIEVYGMQVELLASIMNMHGTVNYVGKSFGVLRIAGLDVDWSLPRTDSTGRKPLVAIDPHMSYADAFKRRDLTINALGIDLATNELIDPLNGKKDLRDGILRAADAELFVQDPLRLYRVMQFISRFEMLPDSELTQLCVSMDVSAVSRERVAQEFDKMLLKSRRPSLGLRWLSSSGILPHLLPELAALVGVPQDAQWHPEGDVFEHTMQTIDAAARTTRDQPEDARRLLLYAALCHDLGKPATTKEIDGRIRSFDHECVGVAVTQRLLKRITNEQQLSSAVVKLVEYHMRPGQLVTGNARPLAYKRLARNLAPLSLQQLAQLATADRQGRNGAAAEPLIADDQTIELFKQAAAQAGVLTCMEEPLLSGRDLLDVIAPGPALGNAVQRAYELQLEEGITDKELLKKLLLQHMHKE